MYVVKTISAPSVLLTVRKFSPLLVFKSMLESAWWTSSLLLGNGRYIFLRTLYTDFEMFFKSLGFNASSPTAWILLPMILDGLTHLSSAAFFLALYLMWCLSVSCTSCGCECSFFCEITVEHSASVLIWALHGGLDLAHRQEISPVFRVPSSLYGYPSQILLFWSWFVSTTEISTFLLKFIRATD